ncbi:hypothetical protein [Salinibacterium sp. ZJ450]|uniref:hypothetical protein n=1 Tax=Salinibacterium sp. ZJ450 TaxID=2708338 RepID=UPI00141EA456|nr:hypothetical protein [Salinibacterium sp. ZJ450]
MTRHSGEQATTLRYDTRRDLRALPSVALVVGLVLAFAYAGALTRRALDIELLGPVMGVLAVACYYGIVGIRAARAAWREAVSGLVEESRAVPSAS